MRGSRYGSSSSPTRRGWVCPRPWREAGCAHGGDGSFVEPAVGVGESAHRLAEGVLQVVARAADLLAHLLVAGVGQRAVVAGVGAEEDPLGGEPPDSCAESSGRPPSAPSSVQSPSPPSRR